MKSNQCNKSQSKVSWRQIKTKANEKHTVSWWPRPRCLGSSFYLRKTTWRAGRRNPQALIRTRWKQRELVVQRLSSEMSGKARKYTQVEPRELVWYAEEELSIEGNKAACEKTFFIFIRKQGIVIRYFGRWAGQGPSCCSMKHIPNFKVIHVRFIKSSSSATGQWKTTMHQARVDSNALVNLWKNIILMKVKSVFCKLLWSLQWRVPPQHTALAHVALFEYTSWFPGYSELSLGTANSWLSRMFTYLFCFSSRRYLQF